MSPERFVKGESERTQVLIPLPLNPWCLSPLFVPGSHTTGCTYKCIDNRARGLYPLTAVASHAI